MGMGLPSVPPRSVLPEDTLGLWPSRWALTVKVLCSQGVLEGSPEDTEWQRPGRPLTPGWMLDAATALCGPAVGRVMNASPPSTPTWP